MHKSPHAHTHFEDLSSQISRFMREYEKRLFKRGKEKFVDADDKAENDRFFDLDMTKNVGGLRSGWLENDN